MKERIESGALEDQDLILLNGEGFLLGPDETIPEFCQRIQSSLAMHTASATETALEAAKGLFDFSPIWVSCGFSNRKIPFWMGGCTWILDEAVPQIQLRKAFATEKGTYLGHHRDEILAHELFHAARVTFDEEDFEELFAYQSARKSWKRYFGPLFSSTRAARAFLWVLMIMLCMQGWAAYSRPDLLGWMITATWATSALFGGLALFRLARKHRQVNRCVRILQKEGIALGLLFRLSDAELWAFPRAGIRDWVYSKRDESPRWRQIALSYL